MLITTTTKMANNTDLKLFLKAIEKQKYGNKTDLTASVYVLSLHRYMSDNKHRNQLGIKSSDNSPIDVIQVTVSDERQKVKVILDSNLNYLVQTNKVQAGSIVELTDCQIHCDETSMTCSSIIIVNNMTIVDKLSDWKDKDWTDVRWIESFEGDGQKDCPSTSTRGYFVNMWSTVEMYGDAWKTAKQVQDGLGDHADDIFLLRELRKKLNPNPVVLVRVLMKFRLYHYAKPQKDDKCPFQAQFLVGDSSGMCVMVLWNRICMDWYHSISVGDVLMIRKFAIKSQYQQLPPEKVKKASETLTLLTYDLSINSHHPPAEVIKVDPQSVPSEVDLPDVMYRFVSRRTLGLLQEDTVVDIIGTVTHLGRYEREPMVTKNGEDTGSFWIRQWINLQDGSSKLPFIVQVYHATIGLSDVDIKPGQLLLLTNVRVIHTQCRKQTSRSQRNMCITSIAETEVKSLEYDLLSTLKKDPVVADLIRWTKTNNCKEILKSCTVGGYCQGLPLPTSRQDVWTVMKDNPPLPSDQWLTVLNSLKYREVRRIAVYAYIVGISYHLRENRRENNSEKTKFDVVIDSDVFQNRDNLASIGSSTLDEEESFPMLYSKQRWQDIKHRLEFPCVDIERDRINNLNGEDEIDHKQENYFTFMWVGVNEPVLLQSQFMCRNTLHKESNITDMLSGYADFDQCDQMTSEQDILTVLSTGHELQGQKMHLVLDCYQIGTYQTEIILNGAFRT